MDNLVLPANTTQRCPCGTGSRVRFARNWSARNEQSREGAPVAVYETSDDATRFTMHKARQAGAVAQ
jgi:hypothetical protein